MSRKYLSILILIAASTFLLNVSSCGYNSHLISISIAPSQGAIFGAADPALFVNFTASGTYEHPPETKDVTSIVTWVSDTPQVAQVSSTGVVSPNTNCGTANVYATFYDSPNQVNSNSAPITVDGPLSSGCPQGGALSNLAVTIGGGTGTITSAPAGINCGTTCAAQFTTGTTVTLTATPISPSSSVSWANCDTSSGTTCTVFLQADRIVTATFN
jgi:hypothetical protein